MLSQSGYSRRCAGAPGSGATSRVDFRARRNWQANSSARGLYISGQAAETCSSRSVVGWVLKGVAVLWGGSEWPLQRKPAGLTVRTCPLTCSGNRDFVSQDGYVCLSPVVVIEVCRQGVRCPQVSAQPEAIDSIWSSCSPMAATLGRGISLLRHYHANPHPPLPQILPPALVVRHDPPEGLPVLPPVAPVPQVHQLVDHHVVHQPHRGLDDPPVQADGPAAVAAAPPPLLV